MVSNIVTLGIVGDVGVIGQGTAALGLDRS